MTSSPSAAAAGQEATWTAGAVARMLGVPASTLRGWHRRYDLPLAAPHNRHRRYTAADIDALTRMKHLVSRGVSTHSAAKIAFHPNQGAPDPDDLLDAVSRLDTDTAVALLDAHLSTHGVSKTWHELCSPALNALGGAEMAGVDHCVDLVHALSWSITTALHRVARPVSAATAVLLACVDGERHTLPLEALRAELAEHGIAARLLGASVPEFALEHALTRTSATALVLWAYRRTPAAPFARLVGPQTQLVLAGPGWPNSASSGPTARPESLPETVRLLTQQSQLPVQSPVRRDRTWQTPGHEDDS